MDDAVQKTLEELLMLALEDSIAPDQVEQINELLKNHPERIRFTIRFLQIASHIKHSKKLAGMSKAWLSMESQDSFAGFLNLMAEHEKTADAVEVERSAQEQENQTGLPVPAASSKAKVSKLSIYSLIVSSAALIFLIVYAYFAPTKQTQLVGRLSKTLHAQWQDASGQIAQGCDLYAGPMTLLKGYAELVLDGGVTVIVQAPSQFTLESSKQIYLREGRVVAKMQGGARQAFVVRSPSASIVDYGTEFGVKVDTEGETETYVYEGQVQIRDSSDPVKFLKGLFLKAGQGAMADSDSRLSSKEVNPNTFVRQDEMEIRCQAQNPKASRYYRWREMVYRFSRDPSLVAHYFLEKQKDNPLCLVNFANAASEQQTGNFGDENREKPTWVQGRWPQKDAVRFERGKNQVIIIPPDSSLSITSPLTISAWLCFPDKERWGGHLISCRENQRINYQFSLFDGNYAFNYQKNRFEFRQYVGSGGAGWYSHEFVPEPGQWYHFAVVFDGSSLRVYINGDLFETASYKGLPAAAPAEIIIGAMKIDGYVLGEGDFDGVIDELMLFNRCLPEQEIRTIYETGKP